MFVLGGFPVSLFLYGGSDRVHRGKSQVGLNWKLSIPQSAYWLCPHPASMSPVDPQPIAVNTFGQNGALFPVLIARLSTD